MQANISRNNALGWDGMGWNDTVTETMLTLDTLEIEAFLPDSSGGIDRGGEGSGPLGIDAANVVPIPCRKLSLFPCVDLTFT